MGAVFGTGIQTYARYVLGTDSCRTYYIGTLKQERKILPYSRAAYINLEINTPLRFFNHSYSELVALELSE